MRAFATTFEYFCENDAEQAFMDLLSKSFIAKPTRAVLVKDYKIWKRNDGPTFWASLDIFWHCSVILISVVLDEARRVVRHGHEEIVRRALQDC
ncbi:hypothetical protein BGZ67_005482 [Mortierella alpina]|nr:hypothetical protein BGZ67_005482 [Mortierella alpina]